MPPATFTSLKSRLTALLASTSAEAGQAAAEYAVLLGIIAIMVLGAAKELAPAVQERLSILDANGILRGRGNRSTETKPANDRTAPRLTSLVGANVQVIARDDPFILEVTGVGEPWATRIELANDAGNRLRHEARILSNPAGLPAQQVELRDGKPYLEAAEALAQIGPLRPGEKALLTLTIPSGEYLLVCAVVDDGSTHLERGMVAAFHVGLPQ